MWSKSACDKIFLKISLIYLLYNLLLIKLFLSKIIDWGHANDNQRVPAISGLTLKGGL
jgi:hypothetical protein